MLDNSSCVAMEGGEDAILTEGGNEGGVTGAPEAGAPESGAPEAGGDAAHDACVVLSATENCTNGIDDNCNGLVDCADPECAPQGYGCVPEWPSGWTAPVALYDLNSEPNGPAPNPLKCSGLFPADVQDANYFPVAPGSSCSCNCGSASASCTGPTIAVNSSASCTSSINPPGLTTVPLGSCTDIPTQGGINAVFINNGELGTATNATCGSTPTPNITKWSGEWAGTARMCGVSTGRPPYQPAAAGGCGTKQTCAELPLSTFDSGKVCIMLQGQSPCPAGYAASHTYYTSALDQRSCGGTCSCDVSGTVTCNPAIEVFNKSACSASNASEPLTSSSSCYAPSPPMNWGGGISVIATAGYSGGSCSLSASNTYGIQGSVVDDTSTAITVCCQP
jgi:hypothetical protein